MNHRSSPRNIMGHPNPPCVDLKWILEVRDCDLLTLKGLNNTALVSFILLLSGFLFFNIVKNVSVENSRYNSRKSHQTGGFCGNYSGCFLVEQKGSSSFTKKPLYLCTVLLKNNPFVAKNKHLKATCDAESPAGTTQQPARLITGPNVQMPSLQNALWHRLKNTTVAPKLLLSGRLNGTFSISARLISALSVWSRRVSPAETSCTESYSCTF